MDITARYQELTAAGMRPPEAYAQVDRETYALAAAREDLHRAEAEGITVGREVYTEGGHIGRITEIHEDATATVRLDPRYQVSGGQREVREPIRLLIPSL